MVRSFENLPAAEEARARAGAAGVRAGRQEFGLAARAALVRGAEMALPVYPPDCLKAFPAQAMNR